MDRGTGTFFAPSEYIEARRSKYSSTWVNTMAEFNAKKISKVKAVDPAASYSVKGTDGGFFVVASSKKD